MNIITDNLSEQRLADIERTFLALGLFGVLFSLDAVGFLFAILLIAVRGIKAIRRNFLEWLKLQALTLAMSTATVIGLAYLLVYRGISTPSIENFTLLTEDGIIRSMIYSMVIFGSIFELFVASCFHTYVRELKARYPDIYREIEHS